MKDVSSKTKLSRRAFVVGTTAVAGGGLALGFHMPADAASARAAAANEGVEVNAWVVVKPDDTCVIRIARTEMGQGTRTGLAQLVAEELECDWKKVTTDSITPGQNLARIERLPHCDFPHEFVVALEKRNGYDHAFSV